MIDLPPNDYICIEHNPHIAEEMTLVQYINEVDILPIFRCDEINEILAKDDFWMVTYIIDDKYFMVASTSLDKCIERLNERRRLSGLD